MSNIQFDQNQISVLEQYDPSLNIDELSSLFALESFETEQLLGLLSAANALYRAGYPIIDDVSYDTYLEQFKQIAPDHPYIDAVEPEVLIDSKTVVLPQKMLSTDKAYTFDEIKKWTDRLLKAAEQIRFSPDSIELKITPKLDGYAAYDDGSVLYTRGDGTRGQDITRAFDRGLKIANDLERGLGAGEIVIQKSYFEDVLSDKFENSRNIQAAIIAEKKIDAHVQKAIDEGACIFYPFSALPSWKGSINELLSDFEQTISEMWDKVDFDIDGLIIETVNDAIKQHMGATRKFHRWQIAFKMNDESAEVEVVKVVPQTSRTGRVSPVAELVPTKLSGATLSRATVHHYNMVKTNGVGPGAIIKLVRSGLVIPKIEAVIQPAIAQIPSECPSCATALLWEADHLICPNKSSCPAQTENTLIHFFKTLGNVDGFGPKVIEKISQFGITQIHQIYELTHAQLVGFGFGDKTSQNLLDQLSASKEIEIEDWRFLAAFGVSRLGGGNCERLLQHHKLADLFTLSVSDIASIEGFAELSASAIVKGLDIIKSEFERVYALNFNLLITPLIADTSENQSPIAGKIIVFTGSMSSGSRSEMEKQAKAMGAKVAKSVSGKTDLLVTGDKVGANKINAARDKGVNVLSEQDYISLISA